MTPGRWLRLAAKELRETLRDKRTLATLVGMPLLLYPLLNVALQQLLLSGARSQKEVVYRVGLRSEAEARTLAQLLSFAAPDDPADAPAPMPGLTLPNAKPRPAPKFEPVFAKEADLRNALTAGDLQALAAIDPPQGPDPQAPGGLAARVSLETLEGSSLGREAAELLVRRLASANRRLLRARLGQLQTPQGPEVIAVRRHTVPDPRPGGGGGIPLAALLPLALALMTATGAVYPAIDLTAGERERGTLEALMCTPTPKFAVLAAKYVAVFTVAMLTALVNLGALAATVAVSDLGPALFAPGTFTWKTAALAGGAMALFAAFFAAALLAVACYARSFKEAQAYLIPLMLMALAPGLASLLPGVDLNLATAAVPLLNVVLLTRDLCRGEADGGLALLVAACNLLYAGAALALAARAFGAEGILYGGTESWTGAFRRPPPGGAPAPRHAAFALAAAAPLFLVLMGAANRLAGEAPVLRLAAGAAVNVALFAGLPLLLAWFRRWRSDAALGWRWPPWSAWLAAGLIGVTVWPLALQTEQWFARMLGGGLAFADDPALKAKLEAALQALAAAPLAVRLLAIAAGPAFAEELFFRGLMFGGLKSRGPWLAVGVSSLAFAAFHVLGPQGLTFQRFAPTLLLGVVLGMLRQWTGSVWPGMLMHLLHNGLLAWTIGNPELLTKFRGVSVVGDQLQLAPGLLAASAALAAAGLCWAWFAGRPKREAWS